MQSKNSRFASLTWWRASRIRRFLLAGGVLGGVWLILALATYWGVVRPREHRFDFYPRWVGARSVLQGQSPYTEATTRRIQEGMFHTTLPPTEDQHRFLYAPFLALLLWPFWKMPFTIAISLWGGLQLTMLLIMPLLWAQLLRWRPSPIQIALLEIFSIAIFRYPLNGYLLGQFATWVFFWTLFALWSLHKGHPIWAAGALLATLVKPEMALPVTLLILAVAWREGHLKVVGLWLAGALLLWGWSHWQIGFWEPAYVAGLRAYRHYARPVWPPALLGWPWSLMVALGILGWAGHWGGTLWRTRAKHWTLWLFAGAWTVFLLVWPQTGDYTAVVGLPVIWLWLWAHRDTVWGWVLGLAVCGLPWVFWRVLRPLRWEYLLLPLVLWGVLWVAWRHAQTTPSGAERANAP